MWYAAVNEIFISDFSNISNYRQMTEPYNKKVLQNKAWSTFLLYEFSLLPCFDFL